MERILGPLAFLLVVITGAGSAGCPSTTPKNTKAAATRYKLGYDYFSRAMKAETSQKRSRFVNVAMAELQKSLKADPDFHHAHSLIALLYLHKGQQALEEIEMHQCIQGEEAKEYRQEADALMTKARQHLEKADKLREGKDASLAVNLSTLHLYFKDYDKAEALARRALTDIAYATPHLARFNIGRAQFRQGRNRKALKNIKQAVFSQPRFCPGHYWHGRIEFALSRYESAIKRFAAASACCQKEKIAPIQEARLYHGLALMRLGRREEAQRKLKACVEQAPKSCIAARCRRNLQAAPRSSR